jgi:hypothetical protein
MVISMPSDWALEASTTRMSAREPSGVRSAVERAFPERSAPFVDEVPFSIACAPRNRSNNNVQREAKRPAGTSATPAARRR